jgi:4-aminobutyrate aminotransferase
VLEKEGDVGAVIAEPIRSTTAVVPPAEYWMRVRKACDRHGALLIFDEIPTCLGRTGKFLATEHTGVVPDMVVLGKGLGGGIWPLAAILVKSSLDLAQATSLGHYTHEKSPLGAAAALAVLDVLEQESLVTRSAELGELLLKDLLELKARHPVVVDVRAQGLLAGIEVAKPQVAEEVLYRSLDLGLSFKVSSGTVLTLTPPLNISQADLRLALSILDQALSEAERLP